MHNSIFDGAARSLIDRSFAILDCDDLLVGATDRILKAGHDFFAKPDTQKQAAATLERLEGYRPIGSEFSISPDHPDLCEVFSVWPWNADRSEVRAWATASELHKTVTEALPIYGSVAARLMNAVRRLIKPDSQQLDLSEASYLQLNHYTPSRHGRHLLQEEHEDGHIITLIRPTSPGLEVKIAEAFEPVTLASNQVIALSGGLLTILTGGMIPPLFHRVRNNRATTIRQSVIFFGNPSVSSDTSPWIENETNANANIRELANSCIGGR